MQRSTPLVLTAACVAAVVLAGCGGAGAEPVVPAAATSAAARSQADRTENVDLKADRPAVPGDVTLQLTGRTAVVSWSAPDGVDVREYRVWFDGREVATVGGDALRHRVTGVTGSGVHTARVVAVNAAGESPQAVVSVSAPRPVPTATPEPAKTPAPAKTGQPKPPKHTAPGKTPGKTPVRSDAKACDQWLPTAKGVLNLVGLVVEHRDSYVPDESDAARARSYARATGKVAAVAESAVLREGLTGTQQALQEWADGGLTWDTAEPLLDAMETPLNFCAAYEG
jgi:hypothetical protein